MLINCPEILIKCPEILIKKPYHFSSFGWLFQQPFIQKMRFDPFDPSPTFKGRSGTVKMVESSNGTPVPIKIV